MTLCEKMMAELNARQDRSAWERGKTTYARELVEQLAQTIDYNGRIPATRDECLKWMRNGTLDWNEYSDGGNSLIYNDDIAERLCTPSEFRKTDGGRRNPYKDLTWLDLQARALDCAATRVLRLYEEITSGI